MHRRLLKTLICVLQTHGLDRLRKEAGDCPGCILAAIVQSRRQQVEAADYVYELVEGFIDKDQFDFAKERSDFFAEFNREGESNYAGY